MKQRFITKNFRPETLAVIAEAESIITAYANEGYALSLRQLYYQFVARDTFPETRKWSRNAAGKWVKDLEGGTKNADPNYKWLGAIVTDARLAGLLDWSAIEDRHREVSENWVQEDPERVLSGIEYGIQFDYWMRQNTYVEVWVEKDALLPVVERSCGRWEVNHMACKGYMSASAAYQAGRRYENAIDEGRRCVLIHLGDHDPSGIDMTRDNRDRVNQFSRAMAGDIDVRRIALNMDQIEEHSPPPNPTKEGDSRTNEYNDLYGSECWELDALEPRVLDNLITSEIKSLIDFDMWNATSDEEENLRSTFVALRQNWDDIRSVIATEYMD